MHHLMLAKSSVVPYPSSFLSPVHSDDEAVLSQECACENRQRSRGIQQTSTDKSGAVNISLCCQLGDRRLHSLLTCSHN